MADTQTREIPAEPQSRHVIYCGVCTLPPEYCEFGGTVKKCQEWLQKTHPAMYEKLWSEDALAAATSSLSVDAQKRAEKDAHKKALKAEAAEAKLAQTIASSKVIIKRVERNKVRLALPMITREKNKPLIEGDVLQRKFVTTVTGLEAFSLENKKVAKDLGKKFATGASVTKVPSGGEEIVVQGDVSEEIEEFLLEKYPVIPEDNIELVESKVKKGTSAG